MAHEWADLLMKDHEITEQVFEAGERLLEAPDGPDPALLGKLLQYLSEYVEACHNKKEEDHLFPLAEQRGVPREGGPLGMMLREHEQSRELGDRFKTLTRSYLAGDTASLPDLRATWAQYTELLKNHYWKENDVLYPMAQRMFSSADAATVRAGIEAVEAAIGSDTRQKYYALADEVIRGAEVKDLVYGLDFDTIAAMLNTLPVELSYVDADDTVRYFSHENLPKIFPRTRGAIGMKVQDCHPQKSVALVNRILEDFKAGKRNVAEFWIDFEQTKVHIRYWPVRDAAGDYIGCLETVQDVTQIQKLEGQRRLLDDAR